MTRRWLALAGSVIVLVVAVIGIRACQASQATDDLKAYNDGVNRIATDSDNTIGRPLLGELRGARTKSETDVLIYVNQLRVDAEQEVKSAQALNVPGDMAGAQDYLLKALDLRVTAITKIANEIQSALNPSSLETSAVSSIAGQMETLVAADVLYAERVQPLVAQALTAHGIQGEPSASTRFIAQLAWLDPTELNILLSGGTAQTLAPGPHGHALTSVAVGGSTLQSGVINRVSAGGIPAFVILFDNNGSSDEYNVLVDVKVSGGSLTTPLTGAHPVDHTFAGKEASVTIPLSRQPPLGIPLLVTVFIHPVPGETNIANNRATYDVIFR